MLLASSLLIIGLFLVVYGADRLVFATSVLCRSMGLSPLLIGMTVVSAGTSLPEMMISTAAALQHQPNLSVGIALGSCTTNILLIAGLGALLHPFTVHSDILRREIPLMLVATLLCALVIMNAELTRLNGIILLISAVIYLWFTVKIARLAQRHGSDSFTREQIAELPGELNRPVAFLWLGVALVIMPVATRMVVDNATVVASYLGMSELVTGLTIISVATSLPELATAIAGARKGEDDIAIGNIIGSNIFNIAVVLGIPALVSPGPIDPQAFSRDYLVMLAASVIFTTLCWRSRHHIGKRSGAFLLTGFVVWITALTGWPS